MNTIKQAATYTLEDGTVWLPRFQQISQDSFDTLLRILLADYQEELVLLTEAKNKSVHELSADEVEKIESYRNRVEVAPGTYFQKIISPKKIDWFLDEVGLKGFVARWEDAKMLSNVHEYVHHLGLFYKEPPTFYNEDQSDYVEEVFALRFRGGEDAGNGAIFRIPFGANVEGQENQVFKGGYLANPLPFRGNGFAFSEEYFIPEFEIKGRMQLLTHGDEIYRINRQGEEVLFAVFVRDNFVKVSHS